MATLQVRIVALGDCALSVELGTVIDPVLQAETRNLERQIQRAALPGVIETSPSYAAILVQYQPDITDFFKLRDAILALDARSEAVPSGGRHWRVPACYDPAVAEDIVEAAELLGIGVEQLVAEHTAATFDIALYGFAPGWAYIGGCPAALNLPRRQSPRPPTPDDALMIAGGQAMLTARSMPTGWYVIGRSAQPPLTLDADPPVCFEVGDCLQFESVDLDSWRALYARAKAGERVAREVI